MLTNLDNARKKKGVSLVEIADLLGVRTATVSDKINGKFEFKFGEALKIKQKYFPEYEIEFLFAPDEVKVEAV